MAIKQSEPVSGFELARMKSGIDVKVLSIQGGWEMRQRLNQMGIHIHDIIKVKQAGTFKGPVLIEVRGSQVALGCGMARKVFVEPVTEKK